MLETTPRASPRHPGHAFRFSRIGSRLYRHQHRDWELNLVVAGTAACAVGGRTVELRRGSCLWIPPHTDHRLVRQDTGFVMWVAWFDPALAARLRAESPPEVAAAGNGLLRELPEAVQHRLHDLLDEAAAARARPVRAAAALTLLWGRAWDACAEVVESAAASPHHPAVTETLRRLADGEGGSVVQLARRSGLSANRLSTLFARQVGCTIAAWRARRRLDRFLALHDGSVTDRALAAGFGSYAQFHRVFRRHLGCAPSAWAGGASGGPPGGEKHAGTEPL